MAVRDKILVLGGYGAVGSTITETLGRKYPSKLIVAGRDILKAKAVIKQLKIDAIAAKIDLADNQYAGIDLEEIHTAICSIEFLENDNFILTCIHHGIHYTEVATSYEAYQRFLKYRKLVHETGIGLIPGTGLMPGLSAVFAKHAVKTFGRLDLLKTYVLLGLGEHHGLDAIRWMLQYANQDFMVKTNTGLKQVHPFTDPAKERLLNENHSRKFYRFNFGDQHIIPRTLTVHRAETRLAFDSRVVTWLFYIIKKIKLMPVLAKIDPSRIKKVLEYFRFGSDDFAVQTHCFCQGEELTYLAKGAGEARATGIIVAYAAMQLLTNNIQGIRNFETMIRFNEFSNYLKGYKIEIKRNENNHI